MHETRRVTFKSRSGGAFFCSGSISIEINRLLIELQSFSDRLPTAFDRLPIEMDCLPPPSEKAHVFSLNLFKK